MKIGVISDIHGNHYALTAVLENMRERQVERLFVLGDMVGYYYHPKQVFDLLSDWSCVMVQGNHEQMLLQSRVNVGMCADIKKRFGSGIGVALERLDEKAIKLIENLPEYRDIKMDNLCIKLCHGAPWDQNQYIYPDSPEKLFQRCLGYGANFIFVGHSHYPFVRCCENVVIANPGSVGQARDKGGVASWLIMDTVSQTLVFQHTPYDTSRLQEEVRVYDSESSYLLDVLVR